MIMATLLNPGAWLRLAVLAGGISAQSAAHALDEQPGEKKALEACDRKLCAMLVDKTAVGEDFRCTLSKTWGKATIKSAETVTTKWGFGDARCTVAVHMRRAELVAALTQPAYKLKVPAHTVDCLVEEDGVTKPIKATLAPKIEFKNGKAENIRINLQKIDGPLAITSVLSAAAALEDRIGLFHHAMLKSVNRYVERHCVSLLATAGKDKVEKK